MGQGGGLESPVAAGDDDLFHFFHDLLGGLVDEMAGEFFQYEAGGGVIGMDHIDIIKPVVPQYIDDQFISGEIPERSEEHTSELQSP